MKTDWRCHLNKVTMLCVLVCAVLSSNAEARVGTVDRPQTDLIVLHSIGGFECKNETWTHFPSFKKLSDALEFLARKEIVAGAHFVVAKSGQYQTSTPEGKVANHVFGRENKSDKVSYNQRSIGIEMMNDGDGKDSYPDKQIDAVVGLLKTLVEKYSLTRDSIRSHAELDQRRVPCGGKTYPRRIDPGPAFPMKDVIKRVFD